MLRIVVLGASGRTGSLVVAQAIRRGHEVVAISRHPAPAEARAARTDVATDVLDREGLTNALTGADAVVFAVGVGTSRTPTRVYSDGAANTVHAMRANGIRLLSVVSAAPAAPRPARPTLEHRIVMPILERVFGATYEDMRRMESALRTSDVDWVALRPPRLIEKPATGRYRLGVEHAPHHGRSLTFGDLATALLDALERPDLHQHAAFVAN